MEDDEVGVPQTRGTRRSAVRAAAWLVVIAGWCALAGSAAAGPIRDAGTASSVTVSDTAEAWYSSAPINTCTLPLGCSPTQTLVSPYPAGTLHVGVAAGQETERSYVKPDLSRLPAGTTASAGHMSVPLASAATDGTVNATGAKLLACLATQPFKPGTAGSTEKPPSVDCLVSSTPTYDAAKQQFDLNLSPFLAAWKQGRAQDGIALVPSPSLVQQTDVWQLTIVGASAKSGRQVTSTLTDLQAPAAPTPGGPTPVPTTAGGSPPLPPVVPQPLPPSPVALPPSAPAPQVALPPTSTAIQPVAFRRGFQYPLAFLFPLALLACGAYLMRLFTSPAHDPRRSR